MSISITLKPLKLNLYNDLPNNSNIDCYLVISSSTQRFLTSICTKEKNYSWKESFLFSFENINEIILIELWNYEIENIDNFLLLGKSELNLANLTNQFIWLKMFNHNYKEIGEVLIELEFHFKNTVFKNVVNTNITNTHSYVAPHPQNFTNFIQKSNEKIKISPQIPQNPQMYFQVPNSKNGSALINNYNPNISENFKANNYNVNHNYDFYSSPQMKKSINNEAILKTPQREQSPMIKKVLITNPSLQTNNLYGNSPVIKNSNFHQNGNNSSQNMKYAIKYIKK